MKHPPADPLAPSDAHADDILDYAYRLYQENRCRPDHDLDNWMEAIACVKAVNLAS